MLSTLLLIAPALALPPAVLGPDGPFWIGPLPPGGEVAVVVDPRTGALAVEGAEGEDPGSPRVILDAEERPGAVVWPDGATVLARYDEAGRVVLLDGPGPSRWRLQWGDALRVTDPLGRVTSLTWSAPEADGARALSVEDALLRTAWTLYEPDGRAIRSWEDPRGLRTTIRRDGDRTRAEDPLGRVWDVLLDEAGRVREVTLPSGGVWRWERDPEGRVTRVEDPAGRSVRWERDARGLVVAVVRAGQPWGLERDQDGRVIRIVDPGGGRIELRRDAEGRAIGLVDAAGDEILLVRGRGGWPASVQERAGGRWSIGADLLGLPSLVVDPGGRRTRLWRGGGGRLLRVEDSAAGTLHLDWGLSGRLARVRQDDGASLSFLRDALGRLVGARDDQGQALHFERDATGNISAVRADGQELEIRRDPLGLPLSVGATRWARDNAGRVVGLETPGAALRLDRDAAGLVRKVSAGAWTLEIGRDGAGRPIRLRGTDGALELVRDPAGRIREERGRVPVKVERDARGLVSRVLAGELEWRWLRDASGRPLRVTGPRGLSLGVDWDAAGRPTLLRGPSGALARWAWEQDQARSSWEDEHGQRLERAEPACAGAWAPDGPDAWRWTAAEGCASPVRPWGLSGDRLALVRDEHGRALRVVGPEGAVTLGWDAVGRLSRVVSEQGGGTWTFRYDALGRLAEVAPPAGTAVPLLWTAAGGVWPRGHAGEPPLLLATGREGARAWLAGPAGLVGAAEQSWVATVLPDEAGSPAWVLLGGRPAAAVRASASGLPDADAAGIAGARGAIQAFAGGPLFASASEEGWAGPGAVALDPLSGARLDGLGALPWAELPVSARLDPEPWDPDTPWHAPLQVLTRLGALEPIDAGPWLALPADPPALSWLPASLDRAPPPLGPDPASLPLDEDPLTLALLTALLRGESGLDPALVRETVLREAVAAPRLPPGLRVPGLPGAEDR